MRAAAVVLATLLACAPPAALPAGSSASPAPSAVPMARDLVLVDGIGPVLMPEGRVIHQPSVGAVLEGGLFSESSVLESPANPSTVPTAETHRWRTSLERIDLRTQQVTHRIDAGTVSLRLEPDEVLTSPTAPRSPVLLHVPYLDGESVLLARRVSGEPHPAARLDRYRMADGALLASRTVPLWTLAGKEPLALGSAHVLLVMRSWAEGARAAEWVLLGPDLSEVTRVARNERSVVPSDARTLAWTPACATAMTVPTRSVWIAICEGSGARALLIVDVTTLRESAVVVLPEQARLGRTIGWHVTPTGILVLLTDLPGVIRVDLRSMQLLDARVVQQSPATPLSDYPLYRDELAATAAFTPDGRYAYVRQFAPDSRRFLAQIATDTGRVVSAQFVGQDVRGVQLSGDGERLYALVADARYADEAPSWLVLLEAKSLREILRSSPLAASASGLVAVVRR